MEFTSKVAPMLPPSQAGWFDLVFVDCSKFYLKEPGTTVYSHQTPESLSEFESIFDLLTTVWTQSVPKWQRVLSQTGQTIQ